MTSTVSLGVNATGYDANLQDAGVARDQISGSGLAAPIAKSVMQAVLGK